MANQTSDFLGKNYQWYSAVITLDDVQSLHGGRKVEVRGSGQTRVTILAPNQRQRRYLFALDAEAIQNLKQCLIEQDFLTIQPAESAAIADEARAIITVKNSVQRTHTVSTWAGDKNDRFDAIYNALLQIANSIEHRQSLTELEPRWWAIAKIVGAVLGAIGILFLARVIAQQLLNSYSSDNPFTLVLPLLILTGIASLLLGILVFLEWQVTQQKSFFSRTVSWLIVGLGLLYALSLTFVMVFFMDAGMVHWGTSTSAIIQDKFISTDYDSDTNFASTSYNLRYQYTVPNGKQYRGGAEVKRSYYNTLQEGDTVTVYYLPKFPRWSAFEAELSAKSRAPVLFTVLLTLTGWMLSLGIITYLLRPLISLFLG